jgi:hypothetical protein
MGVECASHLTSVSRSRSDSLDDSSVGRMMRLLVLRKKSFSFIFNELDVFGV